MQGKDGYNLDAGYPMLPEPSAPRTALPPYTDQPQQPGSQVPQPEPQPGYPQPQRQDAGYSKPPVNTGHPQGSAPAGYPAAPATVVFTGPTKTVQTDVGVELGPQSTRMTCRSCNHQISTRIGRKPTIKTHIMATLLCLFGCWCCVCVPYCMNSCLDVDHYCPDCGAFAGSYNQLVTLRSSPGWLPQVTIKTSRYEPTDESE